MAASDIAMIAWEVKLMSITLEEPQPCKIIAIKLSDKEEEVSITSVHIEGEMNPFHNFNVPYLAKQSSRHYL